MDENFGRFANAYDNVTTLHPQALGILIAGVIAIFVLRRDWIVLPMMVVTCLVPASQRIVILGLDFYFLRVVTIAGLVRIWARGEARPLRWTNLDKCILAWVVVSVLVRVLRKPSFAVFVSAAGNGFDTLSLYLLARLVIRDWRDVETIARSFALSALPVVYYAIQEFRTGRNPFAMYPGVPEFVIVRDGRMRLRGAFAHQILAGCYWVVPAILCTGLMLQKRSGYVIPLVGIACSLFLVLASASSTPVLGLALAAIAAGVWPFRDRMREVRWGIVAATVVIQIAMGKPIWHLYQRAAALGVGGSTGYHRYRLIDAFVNRFSQWAPLGVSTTATWGRQLEDVTNFFILQGTRGGLASFVLFLAVFVCAFSQVGKIREAWRGDPKRAQLAWALGVALFAQVVMMTAVSYFGQILLVLWVTLGAIGSLTPASAPTRRRARSRRSRRSRPTAPIAPVAQPGPRAIPAPSGGR